MSASVGTHFVASCLTSVFNSHLPQCEAFRLVAPIISIHRPKDDLLEVVERKGLGHPDTICDALAETFSRNLCREYRQRFGEILHHNVDKALLCGGSSAPAFGGGTILAPMVVYLAGRAVTKVGNEHIDINGIAIEGSRAWIRENLHAVDAERHIEFQQVVQAGSHDLQALFARRDHVRLANDTSIGVGFAPLSSLERFVLAIERQINQKDQKSLHPAWGEDVKVMGVRRGNRVELTVACAMIGKYLTHIDDYFIEIQALKQLTQDLAVRHGFSDFTIHINAADNPKEGAIYLTVTGTSAEGGDDGQVGRGNRVNGLITPCRPMSLEAAAGKNPVSHVGKIYNVIAQRICAELVEKIPEVTSVQCLLVSRIGEPITEPSVMELKIEAHDGFLSDQLTRMAEDIAGGHLKNADSIIDYFIKGSVALF